MWVSVCECALNNCSKEKTVQGNTIYIKLYKMADFKTIVTETILFYTLIQMSITSMTSSHTIKSKLNDLHLIVYRATKKMDKHNLEINLCNDPPLT